MTFVSADNIFALIHCKSIQHIVSHNIEHYVHFPVILSSCFHSRFTLNIQSKIVLYRTDTKDLLFAIFESKKVNLFIVKIIVPMSITIIQ